MHQNEERKLNETLSIENILSFHIGVYTGTNYMSIQYQLNFVCLSDELST